MPTPIPLPRHSPWVSQVLVIRALLSREVVTRFGEYRLGFFWMLLEPIVSVIIIGFIIGSIGGRAVPEIPYAFFVLNGKLLLNLLTGSMTTGMNAIGANQGLLVYPNVRPLDTFLARFVYEFLTTIFSFTVFCILGWWFGINMSLGNLDLLAGCYLITWLMGCGLGLIFAVGAAHYKELEKIVSLVQAPLVFISAVMFPISAMPNSLQDKLLLNPLVHTIELSRNALFPHYHPGDSELFFPFAVAVITMALGLTLFHGSRHVMSNQ